MRGRPCPHPVLPREIAVLDAERCGPYRDVFGLCTGAGVIPGAVLFGTGWAISGGCPAISIVQVASGYLPALVTIVGVTVGIRLCRSANARYFHLDRGSCGL